MRFNRRRCNITCSCVSASSGSPGNRTQHYAVISRVWATSPRLPFQVGQERSRTARGGCRKQLTPLLLPKQVCYHLHLCPLVSSQNGRICTGDLQVPGPASGHPARSQASPRSDQVPRGAVEPKPYRDSWCQRRSAGRGTVCANVERSGLGGARILVSGSSDRRSTVSATSPTKKARRLGDTGLFV